MKYTLKEFELELNSTDFPKLSFQQFEQMVEKQTVEFVAKMNTLNAQFLALQDLSPLQVTNKFFMVAGCAAVRRIYQYDAPSKNHYVRLEANAMVEADEVELLPGEEPVNVSVNEDALRGELSMSKAN